MAKDIIEEKNNKEKQYMALSKIIRKHEQDQDTLNEIRAEMKGNETLEKSYKFIKKFLERHHHFLFIGSHSVVQEISTQLFEGFEPPSTILYKKESAVVTLAHDFSDLQKGLIHEASKQMYFICVQGIQNKRQKMKSIRNKLLILNCIEYRRCSEMGHFEH